MVVWLLAGQLEVGIVPHWSAAQLTDDHPRPEHRGDAVNSSRSENTSRGRLENLLPSDCLSLPNCRAESGPVLRRAALLLPEDEFALHELVVSGSHHYWAAAVRFAAAHAQAASMEMMISVQIVRRALGIGSVRSGYRWPELLMRSGFRPPSRARER